MATTFNFGDRFSYPAPNGVGTITSEEAQSLTDEQLEAESPELVEMASMVRAYSLLTSRRTTLEILNTVTQQADPRIALILSAAKRKEDNMPLFAGLGAIKEIMYADPARVPAGTAFINRNLFSDGIRRVSAAFTASILLGQFSQIKEQAEHSRILESQAIHDLKMITETYDLSQQGTTQQDKADGKSVDNSAAFYFEPADLVIPAGKKLKVEWQSPRLSPDWSLVGEYTGSFRTFDLVLGIVDSLNTRTILNLDTALLATAELSGPYLTNVLRPNSIQYHSLIFYPRKPQPDVSAISLNVRIEIVLEAGQPDLEPVLYPVGYTPFVWGPLGDSLNNYPVNGSLIITRNNKVSTSASTDAVAQHSPALYFRNNPNLYSVPNYVPLDNDLLIYRVQPWQPSLNESSSIQEEVITIDIPRLLDSDASVQEHLDGNRYSQIAVALVNSLAEITLDSRLVGAIIRNDPHIVTEPTSVVEVLAWSPNNSINVIILDILRVPEDIELAIGNHVEITSLYSTNPKSVHVKNPLSGSGSGPIDGILKKEESYVIKKEKPRLWKTILDEATALEDPLWR